jgi:hypothetical protein
VAATSPTPEQTLATLLQALCQPRRHASRRIAFNRIVKAEAGGWNEDEACPAHVCEALHVAGFWIRPTQRTARPPSRYRGYAKTRSRSGPGEVVPQCARLAEGFHRTDGSGGESGQEIQL